jgi:hypothetical protein
VFELGQTAERNVEMLAGFSAAARGSVRVAP